MCDSEGPFLESKSHRIKLPEDEASDFGLLLEYLYGGDLPTSSILEIGGNVELADRLAKIYILADKYQLPLLKNYIVTTLQSLSTFLLKNPLTFFTTCHMIYHNIHGSQSDAMLYNFFAENAAIALGEIDESGYKALDPMLDEGGICDHLVHDTTQKNRISRKQAPRPLERGLRCFRN